MNLNILFLWVNPRFILLHAMIYTPTFLLLLPRSFWPLFLVMFFLMVLMVIKTIRYKKLNKPKLPPGPKPWPIVGNLPEMLANKPTTRWIHKMMEELNTEIACIRLGNVHVIPVTLSHHCLWILQKTWRRFCIKATKHGQWYYLQWLLVISSCTLWRTMEKDEENHC
jgi:hypothetical protein